MGGVCGLSQRLPPQNILGGIAALHGVLSDRVRLQLLLVLLEGKLCVCVLKRIVACPDTRLSYHLGVLKKLRDGLQRRIDYVGPALPEVVNPLVPRSSTE